MLLFYIFAGLLLVNGQQICNETQILNVPVFYPPAVLNVTLAPNQKCNFKFVLPQGNFFGYFDGSLLTTIRSQVSIVNTFGENYNYDLSKFNASVGYYFPGPFATVSVVTGNEAYPVFIRASSNAMNLTKSVINHSLYAGEQAVLLQDDNVLIAPLTRVFTSMSGTKVALNVVPSSNSFSNQFLTATFVCNGTFPNLNIISTMLSYSDGAQKLFPSSFSIYQTVDFGNNDNFYFFNDYNNVNGFKDVHYYSTMEIQSSNQPISIDAQGKPSAAVIIFPTYKYTSSSFQITDIAFGNNNNQTGLTAYSGTPVQGSNDVNTFLAFYGSSYKNQLPQFFNLPWYTLTLNSGTANIIIDNKYLTTVTNLKGFITTNNYPFKSAKQQIAYSFAGGESYTFIFPNNLQQVNNTHAQISLSYDHLSAVYNVRTFRGTNVTINSTQVNVTIVGGPEVNTGVYLNYVITPPHTAAAGIPAFFALFLGTIFGILNVY